VAANALVQARIDGTVKKEALPFRPLIPNEATIEAMKEKGERDSQLSPYIP
jgi:antitoxin component of RelBE/YafQ-DinJ toxin-antitoxin module